jgi:glycosyltransferase involved in cell wall biosynthesis
MRVAHVSIIHRPDDPRIFRKQCRTLGAAGYEVHLIVPGPRATELDGVWLHAVSENPARPPARRQWSRFARATLLSLRLRAAVYHLHDPHLIPLGLVLKARGARLIYDVHEHYPDHARTKLAGRPLRGAAKALMWICFESLARRAFDGFVCASPALAARFPAPRTVVAANFPDLAAFDAEAPPPYAERPATVVYAGLVSRFRGFPETLRALELLPAGLECRLRLIGPFRPRSLVLEARERPGWARVDGLGWLSHPAVIRELHRTRAGLVVLHTPNHRDAIRSIKLFEYMAAGIPVIASNLPQWREIVLGEGCGLVVDPTDPAAIAAAIAYLLENPGEAEEMGRRGRRAVEERYNWARDTGPLLGLYRRLAGAPEHRVAPEIAVSRVEAPARSS